MEELLHDGMVEHTNTKVFLSRPFTVPKRDSPKDQLVVDLSTLNRFIHREKPRMVTVTQVCLHLQQGVWLAALNLQDTY